MTRARRSLTPGPRFWTERGTPVLLEESHALPLVDVELLVRRGAVTDPPGREGLTRMTVQMMRRGPKGMRAEVFDEVLDALGSTLSASVNHEYVRFHGTVLRRNLEPYLRLLGSILTAPAMRADDFSRLKRRTLAELVQIRDHDRTLANRALRALLFGAHPYGRPLNGTLESTRALKRTEVREHHAALLRSRDLIFGAAGNVTEEALRPMVERALSDVPEGVSAAPRYRSPRLPKGRRVVVVDKPERTQTQLYVGTLGVKISDPDYHALMVANTAFGGTFTSRLMKEVRSERGWSYGAGSKVGADRQREAWTMWTHPAAEQAVDCLRLQLELMEAWVDRGLTSEELRRSKRYLIKSRAFDLETAVKRLDLQLETLCYGLPPDWHGDYTGRIRAVTRADAHRATRTHLSSRDLAIAMVATVDDVLLERLGDLSGVRAVTPIPFDQV